MSKMFAVNRLSFLCLFSIVIFYYKDSIVLYIFLVLLMFPGY